MGVGSARSCFSVLSSLMTLEVIMSAPSGFPASILRKGASSPISQGIFCWSIWSMRSDASWSMVSSPGVICMYSPVATPMYYRALRAKAVAYWYCSVPVRAPGVAAHVWFRPPFRPTAEKGCHHSSSVFPCSVCPAHKHRQRVVA